MICFVNTYPLDSDLSDGWQYPVFRQLGSGVHVYHYTCHCQLFNVQLQCMYLKKQWLIPRKINLLDISLCKDYRRQDWRFWKEFLNKERKIMLNWTPRDLIDYGQLMNYQLQHLPSNLSCLQYKFICGSTCKGSFPMIIIQARQFSYYKLIVLISSEAKTKGWRVNLMRSLCWVTWDLEELLLWILQSHKNFYSHWEGEDIQNWTSIFRCRGCTMQCPCHNVTDSDYIASVYPISHLAKYPWH